GVDVFLEELRIPVVGPEANRAIGNADPRNTGESDANVTDISGIASAHLVQCCGTKVMDITELEIRGGGFEGQREPTQVSGYAELTKLIGRTRRVHLRKDPVIRAEVVIKP